VAVHVVVHYTPGLVLPELAAQVRTTAARVMADGGATPLAAIDVVIDDLALPVEAST
jgi:hypothetical protein